MNLFSNQMNKLQAKLKLFIFKQLCQYCFAIEDSISKEDTWN